MRRSLAGVKAHVERLAAQMAATARTADWEAIVLRLQRARTERVSVPTMTTDEFMAWGADLRASCRGPAEAKLAERLIAARDRERLLLK